MKILSLSGNNISLDKFTIFAKYEGVTVGVFTDKDGKLSGKNGTIFPDSNQREIGDIKDENK